MRDRFRTECINRNLPEQTTPFQEGQVSGNELRNVRFVRSEQNHVVSVVRQARTGSESPRRNTTYDDLHGWTTRHGTILGVRSEVGWVYSFMLESRAMNPPFETVIPT